MMENPAESTYDPRYLCGIEHFNTCDFFEAHEVWEELWADYQGPLRQFYQGLIQVAVCLHHFGNGNSRGARKLYDSSRRYLEPYRPLTMGLDVDKLLREMDSCCAELLAEPLPEGPIQLDVERIPEIHLTS